MKILNLFAGIGGNRTLWGDKHQITAVEYDEKIAAIYQKRFPNDKVVIGDAYEYFENHFREFDFIWASPPCQTHTCLVPPSMGQGAKGRLPDLRLYSMIIILDHFFKGKYCFENVLPYYKKKLEKSLNPFYKPIFKPTSKVGRHPVWANFHIKENLNFKKQFKHGGGTKDTSLEDLCIHAQINIEDIRKTPNIKQYLRNGVDPNVGKYILDQVGNKMKQKKLM